MTKKSNTPHSIANQVHRYTTPAEEKLYDHQLLGFSCSHSQLIPHTSSNIHSLAPSSRLINEDHHLSSFPHHPFTHEAPEVIKSPTPASRRCSIETFLIQGVASGTQTIPISITSLSSVCQTSACLTPRHHRCPPAARIPPQLLPLGMHPRVPGRLPSPILGTGYTNGYNRCQVTPSDESNPK